MIISVTHETVGKESILRIFPNQDPMNGQRLADRIESLDDSDAALESAENDLEKANEEISDLDQWKEDAKDSMKDVIDELFEIDDYIADTFTDALERVLNEAAYLRSKLDKLRVKLEFIRE